MLIDPSMLLHAPLGAVSSAMLNVDEFNRALNGADWLQRAMTSRLVWALICAVPGSLIIAGVLAWRRHVDLLRHGPTWRRLAASVKLNSADRRLLERLAVIAGHVNPAPLVISRGCFDRAARRQYPAQPPPRIQSLRRRLFD